MADILQTSDQNRTVAAISYIWVLSVFVLLFRREDRFIQHHAKQAFALFVLSLILWFIPVVGKYLEVLVAAGMIWGFYQAASGNRYNFPIIADLMRGRLDIERLKEGVEEVKTMARKSKDEMLEKRKDLADKLKDPQRDEEL